MGPRDRQAEGWWRNARGGAAVAAGVLVLAAGCDTLTEVELPSDVREDELEDPANAETLVLGAQADFNCAFSAFALSTGLWADDLDTVSSWFNFNQIGSRTNSGNQAIGGAPCNLLSNAGLWTPMHTARFTGAQAAERIEEFPRDEVEVLGDPDLLMATGRAYEGYATLLLSEVFCSVAFDESEEQSREDGWQRADDRFAEALSLLEGVTGEEAESVRNMAMVGRARANLNLGNDDLVVEYASQVPKDFERVSEHSDNTDRQNNRIFRVSNQERDHGASERVRQLEVDGEPDPRIQFEDADGRLGNDDENPWYPQRKYTSRSDDKPFATGREAMLMIAEVEGGQEAVDIINELRADYDLPEFQSDDELDIAAQVMDERRRELWLQGTRMGDLLRFDDQVLDARDANWETGSNFKGDPIADNTCLVIPDVELDNNPNL